MDYEVEIAIIIGREGKNISKNNAQDFVFGYCIVNDISERSWQKERGGQWIKGKSIAGPCGPLLVTKEEIKEVLIQVAVYCGIPAANDGFRIADEALADFDQ